MRYPIYSPGKQGNDMASAIWVMPNQMWALEFSIMVCHSLCFSRVTQLKSLLVHECCHLVGNTSCSTTPLEGVFSDHWRSNICRSPEEFLKKTRLPSKDWILVSSFKSCTNLHMIPQVPIACSYWEDFAKMNCMENNGGLLHIIRVVEWRNENGISSSRSSSVVPHKHPRILTKMKQTSPPKHHIQVISPIWVIFSHANVNFALTTHYLEVTSTTSR